MKRCWLLQMSKCHDPTAHFHLSPAAEACPVFIWAELSGWLQRLWARSVDFPLHWHDLSYVWWLIEHENTWLHSARKPWNCQPPFLLCIRVETDSGGPADDLLDSTQLNNPMLTTSRVALSSSWASFGKWESVYFSGFLAYSPLSLSLSAGHQSHPG